MAEARLNGGSSGATVSKDCSDNGVGCGAPSAGVGERAAHCSRPPADPLVRDEMPADDEPMSDDEMPLILRQKKSRENNHVKAEPPSPAKSAAATPKPVSLHKRLKDETDSDDDTPLSQRVASMKKAKKRRSSDDDDFSPAVSAAVAAARRMGASQAKRTKSEKKRPKSKPKKTETAAVASPTKGRKKVEEEAPVWKWWEEERREDGVKWRTLEHAGPLFAPPYEPLPPDVHFYYNGERMSLDLETEEVATFYGKMLDHDYTSKEIFNKNFFKDWRKVMTPAERAVITDLNKCNFKEIDTYFKAKTEERKNMTKEEKNKVKAVKDAEQVIHGKCMLDGYEQKVANFRVEPPGLFRGRGDHPRMGMLKRRVGPADVSINCSKGSKVPDPPAGSRWKEVRHDNTVTWLASWTENILNQNKYIMLNPGSKIKGEKDWEKFETARRLHDCADKIREQYTADFKSKEMRVRQRAVALYFIDKLALRAGNEKEDGEGADTVGCCSLRWEHITLRPELDGKTYVVEFDFLGKDSIRYFNQVQVEKRVFRNLELFMEGKQKGDDLFDRLNTSILNKHLQDQMSGLTAKVFRTYNASITLQRQLNELTGKSMTVPEKILTYNRANREVAILCNHQRAVPKTHEKSMENLDNKIKDKKAEVKKAKKELEASRSGGQEDKLKARVARLNDQLKRLKLQRTDREENKEIALGTSKLNYLDPRISVAWCKKHEVPIEKIYNKTQREKFRWAIDMAGPDFQF